MQPSVAIGGHALGRCWGRAGSCILHLPIPQAALMPRCLHHKGDSQGPVKESSEDGLDAFILKVQQIVIRPREWRVKRPSTKATKRKGVKGPAHPTKSPYLPFTLKTQGNVGQDLAVETHQKNVKTDPVTTRTMMQVDGGEACPVYLKPEVRDSKGKNRMQETDKIPHLASPECGRTEGVERQDIQVCEEGELTLASHTSIPGTCTEHIRTHSSCNTVHEVLQDKETNVLMDSKPHDPHSTEPSTTHLHIKETLIQKTITNSHLSGHTKTGDLLSDLTLPDGGGEVAGTVESFRESKEVERRDTVEELGEVVRNRGEVLSERERTLVCLVLDGLSECKTRDSLEQCLRQDAVPAFGLLRRLCAAASQSSPAKTVVNIQELAKSLHPELYMKHLGLDYYWACALCHGGEVERSLAVLLHLHRHPDSQRNKKVANMTQLVLYRIVEEEEDEVAKAVDFVDTIGTELGHLGPALSLWSATFTSPLFRMQQVSEWLVERHPGLVKCLGRRIDGLVEKAAWTGDQDLLQRILHLTLQHKMFAHYPAATSALLQLQCDEGDLRGAEETIKFAQKVEVRVTPAALHRFLALLSRHRRPAPLALLALKYRPPPARPPIPTPPTPKYRF